MLQLCTKNKAFLQMPWKMIYIVHLLGTFFENEGLLNYGLKNICMCGQGHKFLLPFKKNFCHAFTQCIDYKDYKKAGSYKIIKQMMHQATLVTHTCRTHRFKQ